MKNNTINYIKKLKFYAEMHKNNAKSFYQNQRFFDSARETLQANHCLIKIKELQKEKNIKEYNYTQIFEYINTLQKEGEEFRFPEF